MTPPVARGGGRQVTQSSGRGRRQPTAHRPPTPLLAIVLAPSLLVQALWWREPATRTASLAIAPPGGRLIAVCPRAAGAGCAPGQTQAQARLRCPALVVRPPDEGAAAWLWETALHALSAISPVIEDTNPATGVLFVETRGLDRLWGDTRAVSRAALRAMHDCSLSAHVAAGPCRVVAQACARIDGSRILEGAEAQAFLAALPLDEPALGLLLPVATALREMGVVTAGMLAALPVDWPRPAFRPRGGGRVDTGTW